VATEHTYREAHRRTHKLLGVYLALTAWKQGVDCVVLEREQLLPFLDLDLMQDKRIDWVKEDVKYLFPHACTTVDSKNVYATLYLSRLPFPREMQTGMNDSKRVETFTAGGLKAAIIKIPKEPEIIRILGSVTHGIADFP
jgi:hypothetical protein